ncbi:MAG: dienelactone hydrolase family protein [Gemmatimonadota bacterium]
MILRAAPVLLLALAAACGPAQDATDTPDDASPSGTEAVPAAVPGEATAPGELPPAIVGDGGPLRGEPLRYLDDDSLTTGYLAVPSGEGPCPALVIIHEWNGLTDRVRQVADDFAAEGYVTLAADLFQGQVGENPDENRALMAEAESRVIPNLNAAVRYLKSRDDVTGRVGAMGWCYGGGVALSFGLDGENHEATAIFYGRLVEDPDVLQGMDHEVYGTFARLDQGPAPESVERFRQALDAAGIENDLHIYDDVNHGFWLRVDGDPEVRSAPALDAWQRLKAYLGRTLGQ